MIFLGCDHAGFKAKQAAIKFLEKKKIEFKDLGAFNDEKSDYPDYCFPVARSVANKKNSFGLLFCGSGEGAVICANKVKGIRAALVFNDYTAIQPREHEDANIACFAARIHSQKQILKWIELFLKTKPSNAQRHKKRVKKINEFEKKWLK
ncbi:RpiB/LacA/LacB family sugar-phosphate isomerase [Candidatus Micrarchaeota archaeon]|nr:RpiB/LacA/LacB family sugar-phosphate isomerase [Candidatus Micrarchaeota archaeon]